MTPNPDPLTAESEGSTLRSVRWKPDVFDEASDLSDRLDCSFSALANRALRELLVRSKNPVPESIDRTDWNLVELVDQEGDGMWQAVVVDGFRVPYLKVMAVAGEGKAATAWQVNCDDRFAVMALGWEELWRWVWFLSQCMAVSAGYTSHGPNSQVSNPHGPTVRADMQAWADNGWKVMQESGSSGKGYELSLTFSLPNMGEADQVCYDIREQLIALLSEAGGREIVTRLIALGSMEREGKRPVIDVETGKELCGCCGERRGLLATIRMDDGSGLCRYCHDECGIDGIPIPEPYLHHGPDCRCVHCIDTSHRCSPNCTHAGREPGLLYNDGVDLR